MRITVERLRAILLYEPDTGEWYWRVSISNRIKAGMRAGGIKAGGYRQFLISGYTYYSAPLAFLYMTGEWPKDQMDHINRIRDDDRWENLREASWSENMANRKIPAHNTSGYLGVSWDAPSGKWDARVNKIRIGLYEDILEAVAARDAAALELQGAFANLNAKENYLDPR